MLICELSMIFNFTLSHILTYSTEIIVTLQKIDFEFRWKYLFWGTVSCTQKCGFKKMSG